MGWLRHPKTYQEIRMAARDGAFVRPARRPMNLPVLWDDLWRFPLRSWKKHRKTQFKSPSGTAQMIPATKESKMTVKAMFYVKSIRHLATSGAGDVAAEIEFGAAYGSYLKGLPGGDDANKDWSRWTPSGELKMTVTNPGAIEQFELGGVYDLTFEKVA